MTARNRTAVILSYRKSRRNHRLLFGEPEQEIRCGWHRKLAIFAPKKVLGYERWEANSYGTQRWQITVCRTVGSGSVTQIPGIIPGAQLFLNVQGKTKVRRFMECLDWIKAQRIDPKNVSDRQWMDLHNALKSGGKADIISTIFERQAAC